MPVRHLFRCRQISHHQEFLPEVEVSEINGIRSLHLGSDTIQSSMDIDNPSQLVLQYSQVMMGFLLFQRPPKNLLQIGLGGGSFVRWIAKNLPSTIQTVVEINPQVITVAHQLFCLPPENPQLKIIEADGAEYIRIFSNSLDTILVDGFDGEQIIDDLVQDVFFEDCNKALNPKGILVTNWWQNDKRYTTFISRLYSHFQGRVIELPTITHGNVAVIALKSAPNHADWSELELHASQLEAQFNLPFSQFLARIHECNPMLKLTLWD
ncbi:MAG: polyamine aminopropyltransferase [Neisseriaceae bacterium]|nr:polyamine aminopropyltransferase [Neisseriaceae bacterium]